MLNLDMYCQFMKTTPEAIREDLKPQAEIALRCNAAIDLIVEIEGLSAEKEEIAEALALICRQNGMTMEQFAELFRRMQGAPAPITSEQEEPSHE